MCTALVLLLLSGENVDNININIWNYKTGGAELKYNYKPRCKIFYIWQHKSRTKHSTLNQENTGIAFLYHIEKEYFLTILTFEEIIYFHFKNLILANGQNYSPVLFSKWIDVIKKQKANDQNV